MGRLVRLVALVWVCGVAPLELATTLTSLLAKPTGTIGAAGIGLVLVRGLIVAVGLIVGRQLAQRATDARPLAVRWALGDLVTLALVMATDVLPSSRLPGSGPFVWAAYAGLDLLVVIAAALR